MYIDVYIYVCMYILGWSLFFNFQNSYLLLSQTMLPMTKKFVQKYRVIGQYLGCAQQGTSFTTI